MDKKVDICKASTLILALLYIFAASLNKGLEENIFILTPLSSSLSSEVLTRTYWGGIK